MGEASLEIYLNRSEFYGGHTVGELYVECYFYCYTLEDVVRETPGVPVEEWKVKGVTAIPYGRYRVTLEDSPKYGKETMTLQNVPGFSYIRIHAGNTEGDTEGCLLLGYELEPNNRRIAYRTTRCAVANLKRLVKEAVTVRGEQVYITIRKKDAAS